ncbi:MAG TPA: hypothetical protein PKC28_04815 [Bdellovibrionales bacterium]|nr:hypothetical protein [Bdellovibrionales bacterium]
MIAWVLAVSFTLLSFAGTEGSDGPPAPPLPGNCVLALDGRDGVAAAMEIARLMQFDHPLLYDLAERRKNDYARSWLQAFHLLGGLLPPRSLAGGESDPDHYYAVWSKGRAAGWATNITGERGFIQSRRLAFAPFRNAETYPHHSSQARKTMAKEIIAGLDAIYFYFGAESGAIEVEPYTSRMRFPGGKNIYFSLPDLSDLISNQNLKALWQLWNAADKSALEGWIEENLPHVLNRQTAVFNLIRSGQTHVLDQLPAPIADWRSKDTPESIAANKEILSLLIVDHPLYSANAMNWNDRLKQIYIFGGLIPPIALDVHEHHMESVFNELFPRNPVAEFIRELGSVSFVPNISNTQRRLARPYRRIFRAEQRTSEEIDKAADNLVEASQSVFRYVGRVANPDKLKSMAAANGYERLVWTGLPPMGYNELARLDRLAEVAQWDRIREFLRINMHLFLRHRRVVYLKYASEGAGLEDEWPSKTELRRRIETFSGSPAPAGPALESPKSMPSELDLEWNSGRPGDLDRILKFARDAAKHVSGLTRGLPAPPPDPKAWASLPIEDMLAKIDAARTGTSEDFERVVRIDETAARVAKQTLPRLDVWSAQISRRARESDLSPADAVYFDQLLEEIDLLRISIVQTQAALGGRRKRHMQWKMQSTRLRHLLGQWELVDHMPELGENKANIENDIRASFR